MNDKDLKNTPLSERHAAAGAKMVPFSGWNMPVQFTGIIDEHVHTRTKAGIFDICHMGEFILKGALAEKDLNRLVTCRIDDMPDFKCRYGFLLDENGAIIDDLIVFKISGDKFLLVVNAGTTKNDANWIKNNLSSSTMFNDISKDTGKIDIQGPLSGEVMTDITGEKNIKDLKRFFLKYYEIEKTKVLISRTGYTGELGYELFCEAKETVKMWDVLTENKEVAPIGLGARDTLRLEMGYSLYGNDIDLEHTPFESGLSKFVFMEKDFIGKEALVKQGKSGLREYLTGFICEGRRSARKDFSVICEGKEAGKVTSAAFSPCL